MGTQLLFIEKNPRDNSIISKVAIPNTAYGVVKNMGHATQPGLSGPFVTLGLFATQDDAIAFLNAQQPGWCVEGMGQALYLGGPMVFRCALGDLNIATMTGCVVVAPSNAWNSVLIDPTVASAWIGMLKNTGRLGQAFYGSLSGS